MSLLDKNLAGDIIDEALSEGGDFAEIFVEKKQSEDIFVSERQVKKLAAGIAAGTLAVGAGVGYGAKKLRNRD